MKIRTGFVSNSSSSSFVICKHFMTDVQINAFRVLMSKLNYFGCSFNGDEDETDMYGGLEIEFDEYTCLEETENYFFGDSGYSHDTMIYRFMELQGIDENDYVLSD
jgi:hypothetical protein